MIDLESDIYSYIASALRTAHPGLTVYGDYTVAPASFPCVMLLEVDNRVLQRVRTDNIENAVSCTFEANVYSNKASGKKTEAREIGDTLDSLFAGIGFTRTFRQQVPNLKDATIYRIVCRYEAVIDKNYMIYFNE